MSKMREWRDEHTSSTRSVDAGTRLRLNPFDASYIIGLNASTLLSSSLSSSFMIAI